MNHRRARLGRPRSRVRRRPKHSVSVSAAAYERIKTIAKQRGLSISAFVADRINQFLDRKGQP